MRNMSMKNNIKCEKCGYGWHTDSFRYRVSCPSCGHSTPNPRYLGVPNKATIAKQIARLEDRLELLRHDLAYVIEHGILNSKVGLDIQKANKELEDLKQLAKVEVIE